MVVVVEGGADEAVGDERGVVEVDDRRGVHLSDELNQFGRQLLRVVRGVDVGRLGLAVVGERPDVGLAAVLMVAAVAGEVAAAAQAEVADDELEVGVTSVPLGGDLADELDELGAAVGVLGLPVEDDVARPLGRELRRDGVVAARVGRADGNAPERRLELLAERLALLP